MAILKVYGTRFKPGDVVRISKDCKKIADIIWNSHMNQFQGRLTKITRIMKKEYTTDGNTGEDIEFTTYALEGCGDWFWADPWLEKTNVSVDDDGNLY